MAFSFTPTQAGATMIDAEREELLTLTEAANSLPGRPNITTLWRWRNRGVRGVRLETVLVGGKRFTSREALARFHQAVNAAADGVQVRSCTNRQRERDIARAEKELQEARW
jgi:hypothetical protein